ncbi:MULTISPECIES: efflux RND transporter permease subunit [Deefgea]|uniref:AcrB/AcrD/AcrF family protein n=1 Tax=Deefgea chitinilytica TaxID=570276 RepID=A0ABS2CE18_9NEIS|nr:MULTISPECIES: efflux RND transporter permease subunit [Deefgea]MBM5571718.1 AcrB/AcrD/AcrF family protein [Deefgea chitinilytica]MBM9888953.1 efflux RND transporter permease subunit [Deefgea sp. CFH1-16]
MIGPNLSEWAINRRSLIIFLMIMALVGGISAFLGLGRAEDPVFTFRTMVINAAWPGANIEDTQKQLTERIERRVQEIPHVDTVRSVTRAGLTTIFVDLKGSTPPSEVQGTWQRVRNNVNDIRGTLPAGVLGPAFNDDFGDTFGTIYGFTADGFSQRELRDIVENARSRLLHVPDVSKVDIIGFQNEQIVIEFSTERIAGLGLDYGEIARALRAQNVVSPSGVLHAPSERIALRVSGSFDSEKDIEALNFAVGDRMVRLGDIATVKRSYSNPPQPMFRVNGKPALGLAIAMRDSGDILALGKNLKKEMAEIQATLPIGIESFLVSDQAVTVDVAINEFITSLWQAILIIIAVSFVTLGARPGTVVALTIPLTLAIVFIVMQIYGIDLQRISLGALIIALALLVDDAMTTVDAMIRRLGMGEPKEAAATYAYKALAAPMLIGTLVTIAGFLPIGFAKSSAGEYTFSIFAVVGIALLVSWLVAVIFAPLIGMALLRAPKVEANPKPSALLKGFSAFLNAALKAKWLTIGLTIAAFCAALFASQFIPRQFFPSSDRPEILVDLNLPQGSSIFASEDLSKRFDKILKDDPDVDHWSAYVGQGAIRFYLPLNVLTPDAFVGQFVVVAKDFDARLRLQDKLEKALANEFPEVVARVSPLELGPPVGWPVQYRASGEDPDEVRKIARDVAQIMGSSTNTRMVNFDWMEPSRQLRLEIDQDQARQLGVSSASLAATLNMAISGSTITQVRDDIYLIDVVARANDDQRLSFATLRTLQIPLRNGKNVPLSQIATLKETQELPRISRRDRVPTIAIMADVREGILPDAVVTELAPKIEKLNASLPKGYKIELAGVAEESAKSQASVLAVVPLMFAAMLALLMLQLVSFRRLGMVVLLMPMGLIGVVGALLISGRPLGFVAILGILALLGMIAKNAVILIDQIESDRKDGKDIWEAVIASSTSRLRPMMLTALSTILGMIPIAPTVFWGPMAFAIMGGLFVATLLTLVFLPAMYVAVFGGKPPKAKSSAEAETPTELATK